MWSAPTPSRAGERPSVVVISITPSVPTSSFITSRTTTSPPPQQTSPNTNTTPPAPSDTSLSTGAKAGIAVGAILGVLLIALVAFLLGRRRAAAKTPAHGVQPERGVSEYKAELDGSDRPAAELEGHGIARWWSKRFRGSVRVKALNESAPLELPAEDVERSNGVRPTRVRNEDLDEHLPA
jgi:hypothetical protein